MRAEIARDIGGATAHPPGMHSVGLQQAAAPLRVVDFADTELCPVSPGTRYGISGRVGTVGCSAQLFISWHDSSLAYLSGELAPLVPNGIPGGTDLSSWQESYVFGTAPAGAAYLRFNVRQTPVAGASAALTRLLRPVIEQALPGQTKPSIWSESATGMRAAFREAQNVLADDLSAVSEQVQELRAETQSAAAAILSEQNARATADSALAQSVESVSARLEVGGDVHEALVQVTAQATATADHASGSWGVVVDVNGKLVGLKFLNDGTTGQLLIAANEVLIDGTVTATKLAAGSVTTAKLAAGSVVADKIAVSALSAISAYLGTLVSAVIEMTAGTGWQYIRTASKWWADNVNGWIFGARPENGSFFQEFRASSGSALVVERKGGGPDLGGLSYYLFVRDANGVERLVVDPAGGVLKFRGRIEADDGYFSGELRAASGTFGEVTAGYLRNADNSASINLNATGDQVFARWGGIDRIWANGKTRFTSQLVSGSWSVTNLAAASAVRVGSASSGFDYLKFYEGWGVVDTGIAMDGLPYGLGYEDEYHVSVTGYSVDSNLATILNNNASTRLLLSAEIMYDMPYRSGETWGGVTMKVRVKAVLSPPPFIPNPAGTVNYYVTGVVLSVWRGS